MAMCSDGRRDSILIVRCAGVLDRTKGEANERLGGDDDGDDGDSSNGGSKQSGRGLTNGRSETERTRGVEARVWRWLGKHRWCKSIVTEISGQPLPFFLAGGWDVRGVSGEVGWALRWDGRWSGTEDEAVGKVSNKLLDLGEFVERASGKEKPARTERR